MILLPLMIYWARRPFYFSAFTRLSLLLMLVASVLVTSPRCIGTDTTDQSESLQTSPSDKHREGTKVADLVGSLRETGRRWTFTSHDGSAAYRVLENQPLERIARAIAEDSQDKHWKINGTLTEFFDENLLLIEKIERATGSL